MWVGVCVWVGARRERACEASAAWQRVTVPTPFPRRILTEKLGWLSLCGGIISLTLIRGELIIYVRNRVDNDPANFTRVKNDPAIRSMV